MKSKFALVHVYHKLDRTYFNHIIIYNLTNKTGESLCLGQVIPENRNKNWHYFTHGYNLRRLKQVKQIKILETWEE